MRIVQYVHTTCDDARNYSFLRRSSFFSFFFFFLFFFSRKKKYIISVEAPIYYSLKSGVVSIREEERSSGAIATPLASRALAWMKTDGMIFSI